MNNALQEYIYIMAYYPFGDDILSFKHCTVYAKDHDDAYVKGNRALADKLVDQTKARFVNDYVIPVIQVPK